MPDKSSGMMRLQSFELESDRSQQELMCHHVMTELPHVGRFPLAGARLQPFG
jgi:hypothetical protein